MLQRAKLRDQRSRLPTDHQGRGGCRGSKKSIQEEKNQRSHPALNHSAAGGVADTPNDSCGESIDDPHEAGLNRLFCKSAIARSHFKPRLMAVRVRVSRE